MTLCFAFPVILGLLGQEPSPPIRENGAESAARLAYMKKSVIGYEIHPASDPKTSYRLQPEPVLRFTNPVGRSRDGTVFLWLDGDGRPAVVVQASLNIRGIWVHELTSLSPGPFTAILAGEPVWSPASGGVELRPVPDAPKPAPSAEQRLVQMRALCREFAVEDQFQRESWQTLRLLPRPFARYGQPGSDVLDGALFCYVLTTDPEAYLMLEARLEKDGSGPVWQYAFAPSTGYPLRASWKGKPVWERNIQRTEFGPSNTHYQWQFSSEKVSAEPSRP